VIPTFADYFAALPEILLLILASGILLVDLFLRPDQRNITYLLTQFALLLCAVVTVFTVQGRPVLAFNGLVVDDLFSDVLKVMVYLAVTVALVYVRSYNAARGLFSGEFFTLALFATLGMLVMISANHFLTLYIGLELLSLSLTRWLLCSVIRRGLPRLR